MIFLPRARGGHPYDVDSDDDKPDVFTMIFWGVVDLLIGFVVAFIMAQVKKKQIKICQKSSCCQCV